MRDLEKPSLSIVVPTYTVDEDLEEMAEWCIESYRGQCDQVIVVEDGGNYSEKLRKLADVYVYCQKNVGFTKSVNRGWELSDGDFTAIVNSDTDLLEGNIRDLCIDGKVGCPVIENVPVPLLCGPFFVVPREIKEKYGILDERLRTYVSDSEYEGRVGHLIVQVPSVVIWHENQATTSKTIDIEQEMEKDREIYATISNNAVSAPRGAKTR